MTGPRSRLDTLVGDGIEIAAEGTIKDPTVKADHAALAALVKRLGLVAILDAMKDGAGTVLDLQDAIATDEHERTGLLVVRAVARLSAKRIGDAA